MKGRKGRKRKGERAAQETQFAKRSEILCEGSLSTDAEKKIEEESEDSRASNQISTRNETQWTDAEKKILEDGVKSCWKPESGKLIPWVQILKVCKGKLQPCRTRKSIRDKWRNMHGSRAKKPKSGCFLSGDKTKIENKNTKMKEEKIGTLGGRPINEKKLVSDVQMFDPMKEFPADLVKAFKSWHDRPRSKKRRKVQIRLPIAFMEVATARWFDRMWIRRKWLTSEHVDCLMNLLIKKANDEPQMFLPRWTCVEHICWYKMSLDEYDLGYGLMMKYVEGKLPRQGGKAWCEVDNVYGIAHLNEKHWVAYDINIEEQRITVYDSLSRGSRWNEVKPAFENISGYVPWLCKKGRVMEDRSFSGRMKDKWEVVRYEHPPQQDNLSDCGIMAIKFIECLVSGRPLDYINPKLGGDFRSYYSAELFNGGQEA